MKMKFFQIKEDDLAILESELPRILAASPDCCNDPVNRKRWEAVRDIVANIRWDYGPPLAARSLVDGDQSV